MAHQIKTYSEISHFLLKTWRICKEKKKTTARASHFQPTPKPRQRLLKKKPHEEMLFLE